MRRPRWTLFYATIVSAVVIACSDDPANEPNPTETPAQKVDRATDRGAVDVDDDARREDRTVHGNVPREPGADAREKLDKAGDDIDRAADRAGDKIEKAANKTADDIERAGEKIDGAAKKTGDKLRNDDDAPREPGSDR